MAVWVAIRQKLSCPDARGRRAGPGLPPPQKLTCRVGVPRENYVPLLLSFPFLLPTSRFAQMHFFSLSIRLFARRATTSPEGRQSGKEPPERTEEGAAAPPDGKGREPRGQSIPAPCLNAPTPPLLPSCPRLLPPHSLLHPDSPGRAQEQSRSRNRSRSRRRLNFCAMATSSREGDRFGREFDLRGAPGKRPGCFQLPPSSGKSDFSEKCSWARGRRPEGRVRGRG